MKSLLKPRREVRLPVRTLEKLLLGYLFGSARMCQGSARGLSRPEGA